MQFKTATTLEAIANFLQCEFVGAADFPVLGMNEIHRVQAGDIVFVDHPKYYNKALASAATIVLINKKVASPAGKALLISADPLVDFNRLAKQFFPQQIPDGRISSTAKIADSSFVHPMASIGHDVIIGEDCVIHAGVVVETGTIVGNRVIIHPNCTLGADPFYFQKRADGFLKHAAFGRVVIADDVEIGANCTIDRGYTDQTILGQHTKLDAQVHIGHDVRVGKNCLMAAQVGISGYTVVEDKVTLWGKVGVASNVVIGEGAVVMGDSVVTKSLSGGGVYMGAPAIDAKQKRKELAMMRRMARVSG